MIDGETELGGEEEGMDWEAMGRIDRYGEDHWIKMALDFWEGPRRKGNTPLTDINNKDKWMGRYLMDKAKEIREAGVPNTLKGRLEQFSLEWATRREGDHGLFEDRGMIREGMVILRGLERAKAWLLMHQQREWGDVKESNVGIGTGRIEIGVKWDNLVRGEDVISDFKRYLSGARIRITMDDRPKDVTGPRMENDGTIMMSGWWNRKLSTWKGER